MGIFRIRIWRRTQNNQNFLSPPTQIFSNAIFSKMRRQKYFFDFKFGISVKFRFEWCITLKWEIVVPGSALMDMARPPPPLIQLFIISDFYYNYYSDSDKQRVRSYYIVSICWLIGIIILKDQSDLTKRSLHQQI